MIPASRARLSVLSHSQCLCHHRFLPLVRHASGTTPTPSPEHSQRTPVNVNVNNNDNIKDGHLSPSSSSSSSSSSSASSAIQPTQNVSATNAVPLSSEGSFDATLQESVEKAEELRTVQAPNRKGIWSRSQMPRAAAMVGPRFEQTIMEDQPRPLAAIELIHKQPVRWTKTRTVSCDGGGGPLGHPRIFINVDKPQICWCTYCGIPFAHEHHKHYLETLPSTSFPLEPTDDPAQVNEPQRVSDEPLGQR